MENRNLVMFRESLNNSKKYKKEMYQQPVEVWLETKESIADFLTVTQYTLQHNIADMEIMKYLTMPSRTAMETLTELIDEYSLILDTMCNQIIDEQRFIEDHKGLPRKNLKNSLIVPVYIEVRRADKVIELILKRAMTNESKCYDTLDILRKEAGKEDYKEAMGWV